MTSPMSRDEVLQPFRDVGAILEGHFILSPGLGNPAFIRKARVFPAAGGPVPAYDTARRLKSPACEADNLPPELAAIPAVAPGSRSLS